MTCAPVDMVRTVPLKLLGATADRGSSDPPCLPHAVFGRTPRCLPCVFAVHGRRTRCCLARRRSDRGRAAAPSRPCAARRADRAGACSTVANARLGDRRPGPRARSTSSSWCRSRSRRPASADARGDAAAAAGWLAFDGVIVGLTAAAILTALRQRLARRPRAARRRPPRSPATRCSSRRSCWRSPSTAGAPRARGGSSPPGETFLVVNDLTLTNPLAPPRFGARSPWSAALMLVSYAAFFPSAPRAARGRWRDRHGRADRRWRDLRRAAHARRALTRRHAGHRLARGRRRCSSACCAPRSCCARTSGSLRSSRAEAATDKLTGLPNRRALIDDLDRAVARGARRTRSRSSTSTASRSTTTRSATPPATRCCSASRPQLAAVAGRAYRLGGDEFCLLVAARARRRLTGSSRAPSRPSPSAATGSRSAPRTASSSLPDEAPRRRRRAAARRRAHVRAQAPPPRRQRGQARDVLRRRCSPSASPTSSDHISGVAELAAERRPPARPRRRGARRPGPRRRAARRRQGRGPGRDPAQARPARRRTSGSHAPAHDRRRAHPGRVARACARSARLVRSSHERYDGSGYPGRPRAARRSRSAPASSPRATLDPRGQDPHVRRDAQRGFLRA